MERLRSDDAEIAYEVTGTGSPVVLLHPFPAHHEFWNPIVPALSSRYRLILPDLRGHGDSEIGEGPAFMEKHARDLARVLDAAGIGKAAFVGASIGGYILFEFWRRFRARVTALALCDTRPQADTAEARSNRLKVAADVLEQGTEPFIESMIPKLMGRTTIGTRPDLVEGARRMMRKMSPQDISHVQRGMADRPDSVADLKTINVPTLIAIGDEDILSTPADGELMRQQIAGSQLKIIPKAGHYAPWEQPEALGVVLRQFLDAVRA
ncbi:MAG: alpha/beta fold hydrolase [Acidobacteriales bacterium]|nr:alpha/beta fold hydrolase [Candidatus Koribacter versatilis]MBI3645412.1 alpha/beta fold hydrolase [Terriglobales bacterium]